MREVQTPMANCVLCNEPIWSFICMDCVSDGVRSWLPSRLAPAFERFQAGLSEGLQREERLQCVRCGRAKPVAMDWYCSMNEMAQWLQHENPQLGDQLLKLLPFQDSLASPLHGVRLKPTVKPLGDGDAPFERREFGLCDECGEYCDELQGIANEWVCGRCLTAAE